MTDRAANPLARRGGVIGLAAALAGLLTAAGPAAAQVRGYPIDPSPDPPALSAAPPVVGSLL